MLIVFGNCEINRQIFGQSEINVITEYFWRQTNKFNTYLWLLVEEVKRGQKLGYAIFNLSLFLQLRNKRKQS